MLRLDLLFGPFRGGWMHGLAALTVVACLASTGTARAQTAPTRFSNPPQPFYEPFGPGDDPCYASGGVASGTETVSGTVLQNAQGFHVAIHTVRDYTLRFDDPSVPVFTGRSISNLNFEGQVTPGSDTIVLTERVSDRVTAPDGSSAVIHLIFHMTVLDTEPPNPSPGDIVRTSVDHFRVTCPDSNSTP